MNCDVHLDLLDRVHIASPCPMRWEDLEGDGPVRHCGECDLDVHNLSEMTRAEAEGLLRRWNGEGRLCGMVYRRADGTILTQDCPVGLRAIRLKTARALGRVAAALGLMLTGSVVLGRSSESGGRLRGFAPFAQLCEWLAPTPVPPPINGRWLMGSMAYPLTPGPTTPPTPPPGRRVVGPDGEG